jgi:hypothetical protein
MPYFTEQVSRAVNRGETAKAQSMREYQKYWQGIYNQLADIGKHEHAPMEVWQLQQQLKQSTGGKTMWDIADSLGLAWEGVSKAH